MGAGAVWRRRTALPGAVLLEPRVELGPGETQQPARLGLIALGLGERLLDQGALHRSDVDVLGLGAPIRGRAAVAARHRVFGAAQYGRQVLSRDETAVAQQ